MSLGSSVELAQVLLPYWQDHGIEGRWLQQLPFPPDGSLIEEVCSEACMAFLEHCFVAGQLQRKPWRVQVVAGRGELHAWPEASNFLCWCGPVPRQRLLQRAGEIEQGRSHPGSGWKPAGKLAVISGAGSGIGRALARVAAGRGMRLVLLDIHPADLEETQNLLSSKAEAVVMDVSRRSDWQRLAEQLGPVDLLINNAGVGAGASPWETSEHDWTWVLGVNFWGGLYGLEELRPERSLQVTSTAGYYAYYPSVAYQVSKRALTQLTLGRQQRGLPSVVLAPGSVNTRILSAARNRPKELPQAWGPPPRHVRLLRQALSQGMDPLEVAELAFAGLEAGEVEIFTHPELRPWCAERWFDLAEGQDPRNTVRWRG